MCIHRPLHSLFPVYHDNNTLLVRISFTAKAKKDHKWYLLFFNRLDFISGIDSLGSREQNKREIVLMVSTMHNNSIGVFYFFVERFGSSNGLYNWRCNICFIQICAAMIVNQEFILRILCGYSSKFFRLKKKRYICS